MKLNDDFWKIRSSEALYILSSRIIVALVTLSLIKNNQIILSSYFLFFYFFSRTISGLALSHLFDRLDKKKILVVLNIIFLSLTLYYLYNIIHGGTIYFFFVISIILGLIDALYSPVVNAYIPFIVSKHELDEAYRQTFLLQASLNVFGIGLGMAGYEVIGIINMIWALCGLIVLSVCILYGINNPGAGVLQKQEDNPSSALNSLRLFFRYRFEPYWALSSLLVNMILVPFSSLVIPYFVESVKHSSAIMIGIIEASAAVGAICASVFFQSYFEKIYGKARTVICSFFMIGLCLISLSLFISYIIWCLLAFLIGVSIVMNNVSIESSRSIAIPERHRVKIQTIHTAVIGLGNPFGFILFSMIIEKWNYSVLLIIGGSLVCIIALLLKYIPMFDDLLSKDKEEIDSIYDKNYGDL
ncbi:MFS transporter [Photorhabdus australis]|uniref:MFS transporter n=1 Tax=Photorhabdus australis TaxID=286156 RepID=UPI00056B9298|nr:MFS transporter [Photorhabdus australis]